MPIHIHTHIHIHTVPAASQIKKGGALGARNEGVGVEHVVFAHEGILQDCHQPLYIYRYIYIIYIYI